MKNMIKQILIAPVFILLIFFIINAYIMKFISDRSMEVKTLFVIICIVKAIAIAFIVFSYLYRILGG